VFTQERTCCSSKWRRRGPVVRVLLKSSSLPLDGFLLVGPRFNSVNSHLVRLPLIGLFNKLIFNLQWMTAYFRSPQVVRVVASCCTNCKLACAGKSCANSTLFFLTTCPFVLTGFLAYDHVPPSLGVFVSRIRFSQFLFFR